MTTRRLHPQHSRPEAAGPAARSRRRAARGPIVGRSSQAGSAVPGRDVFMRSTKLRSHDVRAVYAARRSLHGEFLTLRLRPNDRERTSRAAVVASRRVGTAVDRNRAKRRLRALLSAHGFPAGVDVVVVAKPSAGTVPFALLQRDFQRLRERLIDRLGRAA